MLRRQVWPLTQQEAMLAAAWTQALALTEHPTCSFGTGLGDAIKGDKALPRDVEDLALCLRVTQAFVEGCCQVLDMAQLGHLQGTAQLDFHS